LVYFDLVLAAGGADLFAVLPDLVIDPWILPNEVLTTLLADGPAP